MATALLERPETADGLGTAVVRLRRDSDGDRAADKPETASAAPPSRNERSGGNAAATGTPIADRGISQATATASGRGTPTLDVAVAALQRVALARSPVEDGAWIEAARLLKMAARQRRLVSPRTASVALLAADAITFTNRGESTPSRMPLVRALELLTEPFVTGDAEEGLFESLLDAGWQMTAFLDVEDGDELSDI